MKVIKSKLTIGARKAVYNQSRDPKTNLNKARISYFGKEMVITSLCDLEGYKFDQCYMTVELTEEEVSDMWNKLKENYGK